MYGLGFAGDDALVFGAVCEVVNVIKQLFDQIHAVTGFLHSFGWRQLCWAVGVKIKRSLFEMPLQCADAMGPIDQHGDVANMTLAHGGVFEDVAEQLCTAQQDRIYPRRINAF